MNFPLRIAVALFLVATAAFAAAGKETEIYVGSERDFRPYAFEDQDGTAAGFSVDLIKAVAKSMGLRVRISTGPWDEMWNGLLAGKFDLLPTVAKTPGREPLIDFSLPHTETFDAFFSREGQPVLTDLAAAAGKEIVVLRSDAAHHQLIERKFIGKVIVVESIPEGLRLVAEGKHDAMLCSKLIATLELHEYRIAGLTAGPPIPDYKRVFSFAVRKGNAELIEKLNQGLRIIKANGEYDRIYTRWLGVENEAARRWDEYFWRVVAVLGAVAVFTVAWRLSRKPALWDDRLLKALTPQRLSSLAPGWRYGLAVAIAVGAPALRAALIPWMGTTSPHNFGLVAIVITTVLLGLRPGLLCVALTLVASETFVMGSLPANWDAAALTRMGVGLAIGIFMVSVLHAARIAVARTRQSELRLASFAEATFEGIVESEAGRIVDCNDRFAEMVGQTVAELKGTAISALIAFEDRDRAAANVGENRESVIEHAALRKDGTRLIVEAHGRPVAPGSLRRYTAIRDITERKQAEQALRESEEQFRVLTQNLVSAVALINERGEITIVNKSFLRLFELEDVGDLRNINSHDWSQWQVYDEAGRLLDVDEHPVRKAAQTRAAVKDVLAAVQCPGRTQRKWVLISAEPILDDQGNLHRLICTYHDITERKHAEEALTAARDAAEAANEAKSQFLANMSHELRTPMNAILGMIDVALPKATDPIVEDCLKTAKGSADLLLTLLDDLLDSAKIESGKLELESAAFSLRRMLDQVTRVLAVRASEKGLAFYCRLPDETPDAVVGDRMRLQQVLLNLAGNAIKFTERGDVEIGLRALSQDGEVCLEFAVRDTGIGISPSAQERLFRPFGQADASMSRRFGGTGLGLSICKSLLEKMGGRIWVESEVSVGSTFYFTVRLPLAKELPADFESPVVLPIATCGQLRILLVEDNPANQKLATYILQDRGHLVEIAGDGQEALSLTEQNSYDVILMDVQMPGMNGLEATAAIRKRENAGSRVPIIAMTAHAMKDDRERCMAAGMDGYLSKPVNAQEMIGLVESVAQGISPVAATLSPTETSPPATALIFNPDEALTRCFDSAEMVREMIQCFNDEVVNLFPQMRAALQKGDLMEVGHLGHRMKGTIVYLGAQPAKEAALRVERFCKSSDGAASEAEEAINAFEHECIALKAAMARHPLAVEPM